MSSFSVSPAQIALDPATATFIPPRFSAAAARIRLVLPAANFSIIETVAVPRIERLRRFETRGGQMVELTAREQQIQQLNAQGIEDAFATVNSNIDALQQTLNLALAALSKATAIDRKIEVEGSYISPTSVGTANSSGTVAIAAHTRIYNGVSRVTRSVSAGSVSGLSSGSYVTVFYRDAARAGGAVTYEATTNAVAQAGNIHIVWQGTIPGAGDPPSTGTGPSASGYTPPEVVSVPQDYEDFQ